MLKNTACVLSGYGGWCLRSDFWNVGDEKLNEFPLLILLLATAT